MDEGIMLWEEIHSLQEEFIGLHKQTEVNASRALDMAMLRTSLAQAEEKREHFKKRIEKTRAKAAEVSGHAALQVGQ